MDRQSVSLICILRALSKPLLFCPVKRKSHEDGYTRHAIRVYPITLSLYGHAGKQILGLRGRMAKGVYHPGTQSDNFLVFGRG